MGIKGKTLTYHLPMQCQLHFSQCIIFKRLVFITKLEFYKNFIYTLYVKKIVIIFIILVISENSFSDMSSSYKQFPLIYNKEVKKWISTFVYLKPSYVKTWLMRSYRYVPQIKNIFKQKGLPEELAYIPLIESSLSAQAVSRAQAVGYWQFIYKTALHYGLTVNFWLDERKNFRKSTLAASLYLKELYHFFDDWLLVIAAYNMGETRLQKLIKKYDTKDFWELSKKHDFPRETAQFVPKVLAAAFIMKSPSRYGFDRFPILPPHRYDVFYAPGGMDFNAFLKDSKLSFKKFKELNPELKKLTLPHFINNHLVRLPKGKSALLSKWLSQNKP